MTFNIVIKRHNRLCTEKTEGIIKKFQGVKTTQLSGLPVPVKSEIYEDEKGWLHVKIGAVANLRQLAEQLWPINSKMTVYYNGDSNDTLGYTGILFDTVIIYKS